jgi:hypothetical protein
LLGDWDKGIKIVYRRKKYFVLGRLEQPRQDKIIMTFTLARVVSFLFVGQVEALPYLASGGGGGTNSRESKKKVVFTYSCSIYTATL